MSNYMCVSVCVCLALMSSYACVCHALMSTSVCVCVHVNCDRQAHALFQHRIAQANLWCVWGGLYVGMGEGVCVGVCESA